MDEEKEASFKVTDRRKFNPDGSLREQSEEVHSAKPAERIEVGDADKTDNVVSFPGEAERERKFSEPDTSGESNAEASARTAPDARDAAAKAAGEASERAYDQANREQPSRLPKATFLGIVNMLGIETAMHLGLIESPGMEKTIDLEAARHMIDMLGVLQERTRGNLTNEEDNVLDNILADLRMQFVAISSKQ